MFCASSLCLNVHVLQQYNWGPVSNVSAEGPLVPNFLVYAPKNGKFSETGFCNHLEIGYSHLDVQCCASTEFCEYSSVTHINRHWFTTVKSYLLVDALMNLVARVIA